MRTAGLTMNDVWADRVLRERGVETYRYEGLAAEIGVLVESVELKHRGKEENYRPYLHMTGELRSVTPVEALPYGISQVTYSPGQGEKVDAFYEFDDQQMVVLASKGYFNSTFSVPEQIIGIEWELPTTVDTLVLAPSGTETDTPVVFTQVHNIAGLEIDLSGSGYDLTDYFVDHSKNGIQRTEAVVNERGLRARSDAINSLFSAEELDLVEQAGQIVHPATQAEPAVDGVGARLLQIEAEIAAERKQYQAERERIPGTPENLYHERVARALHATEMKIAVPSEAESQNDGDDLDLGFESDLEREGRQTRSPEAPAPTFDERKREVARRAADLDLGDDEHGLGA
ncbi:hypothetical protein [Saccharopolyspora hattusasensis]|uniref:hypothetical protein n=1 Tax=Saccharopolyspora hattusasensis TaxID=1128679 RepID=UPI003D97A409